MTTGRAGANIEQLRGLARRFNAEAGKIRQSASAIKSQMGNLWWEGPGAERFKNEWESQHRLAINRIVEHLEQAAAYCKQQADELERATS